MPAKCGCERCGKPKPPGRGRRLCEACEPVATPLGQVTPCGKCGSTEPKTPGRKLCDGCTLVEREATVARKRAKRDRERKPCADCHGRKPRNSRSRYCAACQRRRQAPRRCNRCGEPKVVEKYAKVCPDCRIAAREDAREVKRRYEQRTQRWRKQSGKRKRDNAFDYRLEQDRKGIELRAVEKVVGDPFPRLPVRPLVRAIRALVAREDRALNAYDPERRRIREAQTPVLRRLGVPDRTFTAWRLGERDTADFDLVDKVLTRAGWLWWEVYNEQATRLPLLVVVVREFKRDAPGKPDRWQVTRRIHYGDAGPDLAALALVERAFTGEGVEVTDPPPQTIEEYKAVRPVRNPSAKRAREARAA